ncbi:MAG TPA: glycosyltransferase family 2 protein [Gaiellaceae bacterium]|nr:glycosyltransferase family 2 protein [Gaiellaceae bacterium]
MLSVSIIIPVYGELKYLDACLGALEAATTIPYELILVNNSTHDVHPAETGANVVITNRFNRGFARACNQGAVLADIDSDVLLFLNVDTEPAAGWLEPLIAPLEDPFIGATGARLVYPDGLVQHAGIEMFMYKKRELAARNIKSDEPTRDVQGVTGACIAVRRDVFEQLDGFNEDYWNGYDDVDLCLRIRAAGLRIRYVAESTVMHHESVTAPEERGSKVKENVELLQWWKQHPVTLKPA